MAEAPKVGLGLEVGVGDWLAVGVSRAEGEAVAVRLQGPVTLAVALRHAVWVAVHVAECVAEWLGLREPDGVRAADAVAVCEAVGVVVQEALVAVGEAERAVRVMLREEAEAEPVGERLWVTVAGVGVVKVWDGEREGDGVGVPEGVRLRPRVWERVALALGGVADAVQPPVSVCDGLPVSDEDGVPVPVRDTVRVLTVGVAVAVQLSVPEALRGVAVMEPLCVAVAVGLAVGVWDGGDGDGEALQLRVVVLLPEMDRDRDNEPVGVGLRLVLGLRVAAGDGLREGLRDVHVADLDALRLNDAEREAEHVQLPLKVGVWEQEVVADPPGDAVSVQDRERGDAEAVRVRVAVGEGVQDEGVRVPDGVGVRVQLGVAERGAERLRVGVRDVTVQVPERELEPEADVVAEGERVSVALRLAEAVRVRVRLALMVWDAERVVLGAAVGEGLGVAEAVTEALAEALVDAVAEVPDTVAEPVEQDQVAVRREREWEAVGVCVRVRVATAVTEALREGGEALWDRLREVVWLRVGAVGLGEGVPVCDRDVEAVGDMVEVGAWDGVGEHEALRVCERDAVREAELAVREAPLALRVAVVHVMDRERELEAVGVRLSVRDPATVGVAVREGVVEAELAEGLADGVRDRDQVSLALRLGDRRDVGLEDPVGESAVLRDAVAEGVGVDADSVREPEGRVRVPEMVALDAERVTWDCVAVTVGDEPVQEGVGLGVLEGVAEAEPLREGDGDGVAVSVAERERAAVGEAVGECERVGVGVTEAVDVPVALRLRLRRPDRLRDRLRESVPEGVRVPVPLTEREALRLRERLCVGGGAVGGRDAVAVAERVPDWAGVAVAVRDPGERVSEAVAEALSVAVGERVGLSVWLLDPEGLAEGDSEGVHEGRVGVVGVGDEVGGLGVAVGVRLWVAERLVLTLREAVGLGVQDAEAERVGVRLRERVEAVAQVGV